MKMTRCLLALLAVLFFCVPSFGQAVVNSRLTGAVTDSSGASVAGAQVVLTETGTGLVRHAQTDTDGSYTFPDLPTGNYQIDVKKEGFSAYVQRNIVLEVGSKPYAERHPPSGRGQSRSDGFGQPQPWWKPTATSSDRS